MNAGMDDLYREVILDHHRSPRCTGSLDAPDAEASGKNPSCGDEVTLQLKLEGDRVAGISVQSAGCAIATASGSILGEVVEGLTLRQVLRNERRLPVRRALDLAIQIAEGLEAGLIGELVVSDGGSTDTTLTVYWRTHQNADSSLQCVDSLGAMAHVADGKRKKEHQLTLTHLLPGEAYACVATSADNKGNSDSADASIS